MKSSPEIQALLDTAALQEQSFLESLTPEERSAKSTYEHWSAKDFLAHISYWRQQMAEKLQQLTNSKFDPWNPDDGDDSKNPVVYGTYQNASWEEVARMMKESVTNLKESLNQVNPQDLVNPELDPWHSGREPWRTVVGNSYNHPISHLSQYYIERGQSERALQLQQEATDVLTAFDDSPDSRGVALYNLACMQALNGKTEQALINLDKALVLSPRLISWSKQDSDLVSLRADPRYQALYND